MFKTLIFILYIIYTTAIFFMPNFWPLLTILFINLPFMLIIHIDINHFCRQFVKFLPFVVLTLILNFFLDTYQNAILVTLKLLLVCQVTLTYASFTSINDLATIISQLCTPLKLVGIGPDDVKILIVIALSIMPLLQRDLSELKSACRAKNMPWNLATIKLFLSRFLELTFARMGQVEESLMSKT